LICGEAEEFVHIKWRLVIFKMEIDELLKKHFYINEGDDYTIKDGLVSTTVNVALNPKLRVSKLPVKFDTVGGKFSYKKMTSLIGPHLLTSGYFRCADNKLTSLIGAPQSVVGDFDCSDNKLTSLIDAPQSVGRWFNCIGNPLKSLEGAPEFVGIDFFCDWNPTLPMLRLMKYKEVYIYKNDQVEEIIQKYCGKTPLKAAIWDCAKELRDNGFSDNAKW
jgi:hypothetical protein